MTRYLLFISYDGTSYHGWQIQPNGNSVQAELQRALSLFLRKNIMVYGAGRTDAGVHARRMAVHFDWNDEPLQCQQTVYRLNRILPRDISAISMVEVPNDLHARFSAVTRTYHYYIHTRKDPFLRHYSLQVNYPLDFPLMNEAAKLFLIQDDFAAFCKAGADNKTTLCRVSKAEWVDCGDGRWRFEITANRFLRNMVRAAVGTLMEVGRHKMSIEQMREVLRNGSRGDAGESMPAHALFLEDVTYDLPASPEVGKEK